MKELITTGRAAYQKENRYAEYAGLSSDNKTSNDVIKNPQNGDVFKEIDTGKVFKYNADTQQWVEQPASSGGGGGQTSGVTSFNGRNGAVTPQEGDYTPAMVGAVNKTGDTMTGALNMNGNAIQGVPEPVNSTDVATKAYVDILGDSVNDIVDGTKMLPYLPNNGGTLTGPLNMGNNKITMGGTPTEITDVTNKGYVDGVVKVVSDEVDGVIAGTTPITLPIASDTHLGGIIVGEGLSVDADGTLSVVQAQSATPVADATNETDVVAQFNALLASLRTAGIIAQ